MLTPTSTSYKMWSDVPIPLEMEFTLFNLTNAKEYETDHTIKPIFSEMGPYVFRFVEVQFHYLNYVKFDFTGLYINMYL